MSERALARKDSMVHETGSDSLPSRRVCLMSRYPWQKAIGGDSEDREIIDDHWKRPVFRILPIATQQPHGGERQKALIAAARTEYGYSG